MLEDANVVSIVRDSLGPFDFRSPDVRHVVEMLFSMDTEGNSVDATKLINHLEDKVPSHIISFIVNEDVEIKDRKRNISDCIKTIKKEQRDNRLKDIEDRLRIAQRNGYEDETRNLLEEFNRVIKRKGS